MARVTAPSGARWDVHRDVAPILQRIVNEAEQRGYRFHKGPRDVPDDWGYSNRPIRGTRVPSNHCLAGNTRVLTRDGVVEIQSLAGQVAEVLTRPPDSARGRGRWVKAPFASFGHEPARDIVISRGQGASKTITATDAHRWFVRTQSRSQASDAVEERATADLSVGDRLATCLPPVLSAVTPSAFGIMHGIVFGDGSTRRDLSTFVRLWGEKADLRSWFPESIAATSVTAASGLSGVELSRLPPEFKDLPPRNHPAHYLAGWLAGLIATDGHSRWRELRISARRLDVLEAVVEIAASLGIATAPITSQVQSGGYKPGTQYSLQFLAETVPEWLLIRPDQRAAFGSFGTGDRRSPEWRVVSVGPQRTVEVFCATVESTGAFTLEDWILTGNSWGLAIDIDAQDYPQGQRRKVPPAWLIDLFRAYRWEWGGGWSYADPMHFEFSGTRNDARRMVAMMTATPPPYTPPPTPAPSPLPIRSQIAVGAQGRLVEIAQWELAVISGAQFTGEVGVYLGRVRDAVANLGKILGKPWDGTIIGPDQWAAIDFLYLSKGHQPVTS